MTGRLARGRTASKAFMALVMGLILALLVGCGGSSKGGGSSRFSVGAVFEAYTGRAVQGYVGSLKVTAQYGTDTPIDFGVIKRGDARVIKDVLADKDYRFEVIAYQGTNGDGAQVGRLSFTRRSPRRGVTDDVTIDTVNTDVASVNVDAPSIILCGSTVEIMAEAKNSNGATILDCGNDSSLNVSVNPASAGTVAWVNGACMFTATNDTSMDGTDVSFTASVAGHSGSDSSVLDCLVSNVFLKVHWNKDLRRGLPGYANSARLALVNGGIEVASVVINRPSGAASIEDVDFGQKIDDGSYDLVVEAFTDFGGTGKVVATETFGINVDPGEAPITINMDSQSFDITECRLTIVRDGNNVVVDGTMVLFEGETVEVMGDALNAAGEVCLTGDDVKLTFSGGSVQQIDNNHVKATVRGQGSTVTCNFGDVPSPFVTPIDVVFGSPGIIIIWDPPTRDPAPGYAKSAQAEIFDGNGDPIAGFAPFCVNRPASGTTAAYWTERLLPGTVYTVRVTLYPGLDCAGPALMDAVSGPNVVPADGSVSASTFDFPTTGNASNVEVTVTRADGSIERYVDITPPPAGRRNGPLFLSSGEQVTLTSRATDAAGTVTFFTDLNTSVDNDVTSYDATNGRLMTNKLGLTFITATAQAGRGPELVLEARVMQPGVVAFSDWDDTAFGTGAVKTYLYVPGARVNSPRGDKIWEVPYRDDAYLGRALAEPGVVLPTGFITGYDVVQPAINSQANRLALVVAPFDTISGNVTYYKDLVVMDVSYDANGAPIFGNIRPQNVPYDTADQFMPQWGPQQDSNLDGVLYFSSMEFDRNTGDYLAGMERDIYERTNVDANATPGTNLTSGIAGNLLWPAVAPDNGEMSVIRKMGFGTDPASATGVGRIVTIDLSPFAPSGEQIDDTASAASRIGYVASKGIQIPGSSNPATLVNPDKYYIAFARSFDGGFTTQVELIRAERTQAALGAFITQQLNASNPFCAAIDGTTGAEFTVRNPRRVMCFLYNNTELRVKNVTSPAAGGIGSLITTLDPMMANTTFPSQPTFPAPFDVFDPLPR